MSNMNRLIVARNPYQGMRKRVLCVCSAGVLRSPTAAVVIAQEFGHNTRAAGLAEDYALILVDEVLLDWADEIVCMERGQKEALELRLNTLKLHTTPVICLNIPDSFQYMDPILVDMIKNSYREVCNDSTGA